MTDTDELVHDGDDLHALMERALTGLHAPADRMGAGAVRAGRKVRRRHRVGTALVTAAAVSVAAVAITQLPADPTASRDGGPGPATTGTDTPRPPAEGWWDMPAPTMRDRLADLLPDGTRILSAVTRNTDRAPGEPAGPMAGYLIANVRTDTVDGPGGLNLVFYAPGFSTDPPGDVPSPDGATTDEPTPDVDASKDWRLRCPGNLTSPDYCRVLHRPDGSVLGREAESIDGGVVVREVNLAVEGGGIVYLAAANSTDDKWGLGSEVSATEPPLTLEQMWDVAEDSTWQDWTPPEQ